MPSPAAPKSAASKARRLSYNEQRELAQLPEKIQHLEAEQAQLHTLISDPAVFQRNKDQATAALHRLQALTAELEAAYARWDALENSASSASRV
jgi:ATP-binding cassette subfamily F protein uup